MTTRGSASTPQHTQVWTVGSGRTLHGEADLVAADQEAIARAAALLRAGKLVAFPTETVYGLGADATSEAAVAGIFAAKERPLSDPVIVHLADAGDVSQVADLTPPSPSEISGSPLSRARGRGAGGVGAARDLTALVERLAERFWPGPLTLVLPRAGAIPALVAAGGATVGVRVPGHAVARALIRAAGVPVAAPSANRFMHTSPTTAAHVLADLDGRIAGVLDGGPCAVGVESTVLDLTSDPPRLLRPGGVALEALREVLPEIAAPGNDPSAAAVAAGAIARAPGQMERHYAPRARMMVFAASGPAALAAMVAEIAAAVAAGQRVGALGWDEEVAALMAAGAERVEALGPEGRLDEAARRLYGALRALDAAGVDGILGHTFGDAGLGLALTDRLRRAAGGALRALPAS
ncbi:MAG TPA: L-threonylcarbamoyladenylate synthase [Ktedonobacterales bacterium]